MYSSTFEIGFKGLFFRTLYQPLNSDFAENFLRDSIQVFNFYFWEFFFVPILSFKRRFLELILRDLQSETLRSIFHGLIYAFKRGFSNLFFERRGFLTELFMGSSWS